MFGTNRTADFDGGTEDGGAEGEMSDGTNMEVENDGEVENDRELEDVEIAENGGASGTEEGENKDRMEDIANRTNADSETAAPRYRIRKKTPAEIEAERAAVRKPPEYAEANNDGGASGTDAELEEGEIAQDDGASGTEEGENKDRMEDIADGAPSLTQFTAEDGGRGFFGHGGRERWFGHGGRGGRHRSDRGALGRSAISGLTFANSRRGRRMPTQ
jgi:hypothetical protein